MSSILANVKGRAAVFGRLFELPGRQGTCSGGSRKRAGGKRNRQ